MVELYMMPDKLRDWLEQLDLVPERHQRIAGGAGLRCYYRIWHNDKSWVVMDASAIPACVPDFIAVDRAFARHLIHVPMIYAEHEHYLLLEDFGDSLYANALSKDNADQLYQQALACLRRIQACQAIEGYKLPNFVEQHCLSDLQLWQTWFVEKHLQYTLNEDEQQQLQSVYQLLTHNASIQPQVCIHRDYHSRNLFALENGIGVIDFQNLMHGPVTYDLVSLVRDCYIDWPKQQVKEWIAHYYQLIDTVVGHLSLETFEKMTDLMGVQRHLKALGTFARKYQRDYDADYLQEMPRTINYLLDICQQYDELREFGLWFAQRTESLCTAP